MLLNVFMSHTPEPSSMIARPYVRAIVYLKSLNPKTPNPINLKP